MSSSLPTVLLLGSVNYAVESVETLAREYVVEHVKDITRARFIENCKIKYRNVTVIYLSFESVKMVGPFDRELVRHFPESLQFICSNGAGYDAIDVKACKERNIRVSNTPAVVDAATADVAVALILNTCRNVIQFERSLRLGQFGLGIPFGSDIEGKKLGILGMGGIGKAIAKRMRGFDVHIQYHNRHRLDSQTEEKYDATYVALEDLLKTSDIISVNVPLNDKTRHLIGKPQFALMKGTILINTARGAVIDEEALVEALDTGKVKAVGLDVYENEPVIHPKLLDHPNATLLPHIGTSTVETETKMEERALANVRKALEKKTLLTPVPEHKQWAEAL